jgi:glycosyltransferase involved in cell wall biosynthesis
MIELMKLSVIMPVYNEEATVAAILDRLVAIPTVNEVIVVNDGSRDNSEQKIISFMKSRQKNAKKIKYFAKDNGGKGSAVRLGLTKVTGDYTMIQDADLEYDPEDIPELLKPIKRHRSQVVYGSRFLGPHSNLLFWHRAGNALLNLIVNLFYNTTLSDMETCYKLLPTKLFKALDLQADKFDMEPEITCKVLKRGYKIYEVPITYVGRDFSEGKKITWRDGISAFRVIIGLRLAP